MTCVEDAFRACEETVRAHDPDRHLSALFAPVERRPHLFALYAFNYEVARIAESTREPMMAEIRLQWWREAAEGAHAGSPRAHPLAEGLADLFAHSDVTLDEMIALIDVRSLDAGDETFADLVALEAYADATSGALMRVAARVLGAGDRLDAPARAAGIGYGLTGLMRAVPFHAMRRKLYLPLALLAEQELSPDAVFAGKENAKVRAVMDTLGARALAHLEATRAFERPGGKALAAILPAATSFAYLKAMAKPGFDPFHTPADLPTWRRQLSLMAASLKGRI